MAKKPKEPVVKPRCSGEWTEARFNSFVKSALRQATRRWAPIQHAKKDAWRARGLYECSGCNKIVPLTIPGEKKRLKNVIVDHINPLVPTVEGFTSWDDLINNMFCEKENLQVLCKSCHDVKGVKEREERKEHKNWPSLTPEYNSWRAMRARCLSVSHEAYSRYGGAGITICDEWVNSFETFKSDMGERPKGTSLDRVDNSLGYFPSNCKWSTAIEQANNRSSTVYLELDGDSKTLTEWSKELGVPVSTLANRLGRGDSNERALTSNYKKKGKVSLVYTSIEYLIELGYTNEEIHNELSYHKDTIRKAIAKIGRANEKSKSE
mgnify:CR=1 FL=1